MAFPAIHASVLVLHPAYARHLAGSVPHQLLCRGIIPHHCLGLLVFSALSTCALLGTQTITCVEAEEHATALSERADDYKEGCEHDVIGSATSASKQRAPIRRMLRMISCSSGFRYRGWAAFTLCHFSPTTQHRRIDYLRDKQVVGNGKGRLRRCELEKLWR